MRGKKAKVIRQAFFKKGISIVANPYTIFGSQIVASRGRRTYQRMKELLR